MQPAARAIVLPSDSPMEIPSYVPWHQQRNALEEEEEEESDEGDESPPGLDRFRPEPLDISPRYRTNFERLIDSKRAVRRNFGEHNNKKPKF